MIPAYMIALIVSLVAALEVQAQVKVSINSGNPASPFPQFLPYENSSSILSNLANRPGVGVTHAEMEQTIRDAYQIMMNRATKPGGGVGGIDYVYYKSNPSCSEGSGYALLGAVAMADKATFDGLWLWIHDHAMNKVKRYSNCKESSPGYAYSRLPAWTNNAGANSAADGDFDIGLALLCAYYQWGEFMGINDACGNPVSYKYEAIEFLKAMTDTLAYAANGNTLVSGDIGLDGYFKGGDTWQELTDWASSTANTGFTRPTESKGPQSQYFDYTAPSYFKQFADFFSTLDSAKYAWNIYQFRRAEASSDWLMSELYKANPRHLPICGNVSLSGTTASFRYTGSMGEDFRLAWRTILSRVWHGNPTYSWNPSTHQVEVGKPNTALQDMAKRFATFMWDQRQSPWNNSCIPSVGTDPFNHWGPSTVLTDTRMDGSLPAEKFFFLNWLPSVGSPSAVTSQDFNLMAELYRYIEIEWDVDTPGDGYLTSVPFYFHGWYRLLGLLVLSGNYHAPDKLKPISNMKIYMAANKTFAFNNDTITYTIDYRNFGSQDAHDVTIVDTLHNDFVFVEGTNGALYDNASHTVTWNIGMVKGFKSSSGITPTKGQVKLKIKVTNPTINQYRNKATITSSNGSGWTSNEYPNNMTSVMERNYVDIAKRALVIDKKASVRRSKPGSTVDFTIDFKNTSEAGWINGGRPGVHFSFALSAQGKNGHSDSVDQARMNVRMFHDAQEAYIDYGNYRLSYFAYDTLLTSVTGGDWANPAWRIDLSGGVVEGVPRDEMKLVHENIVEGQDSIGKWNQRIIIQFSDPLNPNRTINLATIDRHVSGYRGIAGRIHRGGTSPFRAFWYVSNTAWSPINWSDDWSFDPNINQDEALSYFPITNDWSNPDKPDIPVNTWNPKACSTSTKTVNNILVEEWDGYTWRRVAGNGPMPGREANNVVIRDTIPDGFSFVAFTGESPLGIPPAVSGNVITWTIPKLQIQQGGTISYTALAKGSCPETLDRVTVNRAWISADKESPFADSAIVTMSCDSVARPPVPHHFDIITDTTAIDQFSDEPLIRLSLDAGVSDTVVYAVIRDKSGLLIGLATNAHWSSRDTTVAMVTSSAAYRFKATISKNDRGSAFVIVNDPAKPDIKPDSIAISAAATPPWPAIASAKIGDDNGDIIPDFVTVTLNNSFQVNQKLDSMIVYYRGDYYSFPASMVTQRELQLRVTIDNLTTADAQPAGRVTLVMTVEGDEKRVAKNLTDGVGPIITSARLGENLTGSRDTLSLTFSEPVKTMLLTGPLLQVIKKTNGDTLLLTVHSLSPVGIYSRGDVTVSAEDGYRIQVGDFVRFVPGEDGQTCGDLIGNLPHRLNKPAVITAKSPQIRHAWYTDENGDGIVEDLYITFARPVSISDMYVNMNRGVNRVNDINESSITYTQSDSTGIHISLPAPFAMSMGVETSGSIFLNIQFMTFGESRTGVAIDSAAPVIIKAVISPSIQQSESNSTKDTLRVTFSENVEVINTGIPFNFENSEKTPYSMTLSHPTLHNTTATFIISGYPNNILPATGDTIWINKNAIGDTCGNVQKVENNRRVMLSVQPVPIAYTVKVGPNPYIPDKKSPCLIKVTSQSKLRINMRLECSLIILDCLGNSVIPSTPMVWNESTREMVYEWDGSNSKGRLVGTGTYLVFVKISDGIGDSIEKIPVGVKRTKKEN